MRDVTPPFQFDVSALVAKAARHVKKRTDGGLYLILELMLTGIRQFFTFEEGLRATNPDFPGELGTRLQRHDLQPYFSALEMLRGHLYRCLTQVAIVANTKIPKIADHMRYENAWQLAVYKQPQLMDKENRQPTDPGSATERG